MADKINNSVDLQKTIALIEKLNPESREIMEKGIQLLGFKDFSEIPGIDNPDMIGYFITGTRDLINRYGEEYISRYRCFFIDQLEYLATLI